MKINTIALVIILSSTVANVQSTKQCIICKNGITTTFMPRAEIGDTSTCKQIVQNAAMFDTDSDMCQALLDVEDVCCPFNPCKFCVDQVVTANEDTSETGCGELLELATLFELESNVCDELKKAELTCCPKTEDELLDEEDELFEEDTSVGRPPDSQPSAPLVNPILSEAQASNPSSSSSMISSVLVVSSLVMFAFF